MLGPWSQKQRSRRQGQVRGTPGMWVLAPCPWRPVETGCGRQRLARIRRHSRTSLGPRVPSQRIKTKAYHREQQKHRVGPSSRDLKERCAVTPQLVLQARRDGSLPIGARALCSKLLPAREARARTGRAAAGRRQQVTRKVMVTGHRHRHRRRARQRREHSRIVPVARFRPVADMTSVGVLTARSVSKSINRLARRGTVVL